MGQRRGFTLIELFLTLGLIAMVGSVLLIQAKPMLDRYHFRQGVSKLEREIRFSKRLSEVAHADIEFQIEDTKAGLECTRLTDEPLDLPRTLDTVIKIPHLHLEEKKNLSVTFTGSGALIGEKHFTVSNNKEKWVVRVPAHSTHLIEHR
ncbi:MAG: type II secretion system protein [Simkaniaceae bacterium]|nr:MAG: type II secretion system protein [Simkaniaceae bacterium]